MGRRREEQQPSLGTGTPGGPCPAPDVPSAPSSSPPVQHRKLLTPSDNTQHHAHFHKYKASRVGQRGRQEWGMGAAPTPGSSLLPPAPRVSGASLRFPPALKIVLAARPSVPLATSCWMGSCQCSGLGLPLNPPNSQPSSEEVGRPQRSFLGAPGPPRPSGAAARAAVLLRSSGSPRLGSRAAPRHRLGVWGGDGAGTQLPALASGPLHGTSAPW